MIRNAKIVAIGVNAEDYHQPRQGRGTSEYAMSSSSLREFSKCPKRWFRGYESPESKSMDWGNLLDTRLLTPDQCCDRYVVKPATYKAAKGGKEKPWRANAGPCKAWLKDNGHKKPISEKELAECDEAISRLREDDVISAFLDCSDTQVELSGEWHDDTGIVIPIRALLDLAPRKDSEFMKCLGDLKSTRNASLMAWQRWCFQAGYHIQAAFNTDLYIAATQEDRATFCFIVQENFPPWQTAKRMMSQDFMELGRLEYKRLLSNYCHCIKHLKWPDYDEHDEAVQGWSLVRPEPFMAERAMFAPKFNFIPEEEMPDELRDDQEVIP